MFIPIVTVIGILVVCLIAFFERDSNDKYLSAWYLFIGSSIIIIWSIFTITNYYNVKGTLLIIDKKIELTEQINKEKTDSIMPILEKYPALEKEIVSGIDVSAFAVLGDVYPELKSNESYNQQVALILANIQTLTDLKLNKLDIEKNIYISSQTLWFLN